MSSRVPSGTTPHAATSITAAHADASWDERLAAFRASHPPNAITLAGHEWRYLTGGSGARPLLLLHGSHSDGESLFGLMAGLERRWRVITPTYPERLDRVAELVDGLADLVEALAMTPALVAGYSLGGYLAQALAWRHPERVAGLALLHTGAPDPDAARAASAQNALLAAAPPAIIRTTAPAGVAALVYRDAPGLTPAESAFWRRYLTRMAIQVGKRRMLAHGRLVVDFLSARTVQPPARTSVAPALLMHGGRDHVIEPSERRALEGLYPHASCTVLGRAGHLSALTAPDQYVAAIEASLLHSRG